MTITHDRAQPSAQLFVFAPLATAVHAMRVPRLRWPVVPIGPDESS